MTDQELIQATQNTLTGTPTEYVIGARYLMPLLADRITALLAENTKLKEDIEILSTTCLTHKNTIDYLQSELDSAKAERDETACESTELENINTLKLLLNGKWVETEKVEKALEITFAEGFRQFNYSRTAEWWSIVGKTDEERAREGQKITTYFRLKTE